MSVTPEGNEAERSYEKRRQRVTPALRKRGREDGSRVGPERRGVLTCDAGGIFLEARKPLILCPGILDL